MEKNFLSMKLICSTKGVQFDKLNNYIIPFKFTNFNSIKKRIFHLSSRNGDQKRFPRMRGMGRKERSSATLRILEDSILWSSIGDPISSRGTCKIYPPGHRERTGGVARAIRITDSEKRSFSLNVCVSANRIARWNGFGFASSLRPFRLFISLSLSPLFSLVLPPTESIGCAHVNGNNSFSRTTIFSKSLSVSLFLSLSPSVSLCARAFRFPFQQASINGSCQNVTWLAGMGGGREVVAFCGHFAEHRYGKVRKARRDNWRMRILKLGLVFFPLFLSSSFFSPLLCDPAQQR